MERHEFDVLIVGAGLSGIGAAYHLQTQCPSKSYAILEGRERLGGTWDLFRYPGIRSDSDMYTLGYSFRPWTEPKAIADGPSILRYIRETAEEYGIDRHIRFSQRVAKASWSSDAQRWTVEANDPHTGEPTLYVAKFVFMCAGYYDYDQGYTPEFPGRERFGGAVIHPQFWDESVDYEGKRVVVIGSGATAVTLVPSLAKKAAQVTMLQRSPSYIVSAPGRDVIADALRERISEDAAYKLTRVKNVLISMGLYGYCRAFPNKSKEALTALMKRQVKGHVDADTHFNPSYAPWDQRLCLVPDGDLFKSLRQGRASVVTDHIDTFTEDGIKLRSGEELKADVIVTATGLKLKFLGGLAIEIDGLPFDPTDTVVYKGMMMSDVPNLAFAIGYTNASWTLKCDLTCEYVCKLLTHMDEHGYGQCCPRPARPQKLEPFLNFSSGYVQRAIDSFPSQGERLPWRIFQNYFADLMVHHLAPLEDSAMKFSPARL